MRRSVSAGRLAAVMLAALAAMPTAAAAQTGRTPATAPASTSAPAQRIAVEGVRVEQDGSRTRLILEFSATPEPAVFLIADPPRLVIDVADVEFKPAVRPPTGRAGVIEGYRFGLLAPGRSRLVADLGRPVAVDRAELLAGANGRVVLSVVLVEADEATFRTAAAAAAVAPATPVAPPKAARGGDRAARPRPLIVLDPGHGGLDPGAVGTKGVLEKDIVLAVARQLKMILDGRQRYDLVLTRGSDVFIGLEQRVAISEQATADLFISIHADSLQATDVASTVRGATIYTLSEKASDEQARRLAEKENAVDILAGLGGGDREALDPVRDILIDLLRRETSNFSADFRSLLVRELGKSIALSRDPTRSAAFKVLQQTQTPSVLVELGYMSNTEDQALMTTPAWQRKVAASIAEAVDTFFARRVAGQRPR